MDVRSASLVCNGSRRFCEGSRHMVAKREDDVKMFKRAIANLTLGALLVAVGGGALRANDKLPTKPAKELSIVLTGQSLIINDIRAAGVPYREIKPLLDADVVFTNFETTVRRPGDSVAQLDPVSGTYGPPEALDGPKQLGFNLLSLANNHIYDLHEPGLLASLEEAEARGFVHAGIGRNMTEASAPGYLRTPNGTVALVSLASGFLHGKGRASDTNPSLNELAISGGDVSGSGQPDAADAERNLAQIREARKHADLVIVSHHNHVYDRPFTDLMLERSPDRLRPPAWVRAWTHREIDAGANVIVMHGAPFMQGVEIYRGKPIFYDTGNFIFQVAPQYVDLFGPLAGECILSKVTFRGRDLSGITFQPIALDPSPSGQGAPAEAARGLPAKATKQQGDAILERLADLSREFGTALEIGDGVASYAPPAPEGVR
jgi:hypothetical protein